MAKNDSTTAPGISKLHASIDPTDLQNLVADLRINHLHLSNLLSLAEERAADEMETIVVAARRYLDDVFCIWEKIETISNVEAEKVGA